MSNKFSDFDFGFNLFNYDSFLPNSHHITSQLNIVVLDYIMDIVNQ